MRLEWMGGPWDGQFVDVSDESMTAGSVVVEWPVEELVYRRGSTLEPTGVRSQVECKILPFWDGKRVKRVIAWPEYKMRGCD